jgi:phosphoribosylformylglycinamidine cyclo-ligase
MAELGRPLGDALLEPHRCYWPVLEPLLKARLVRGIVHITGGGLTDNTPRILPKGCAAEIRLGSWPVLPIFQLIGRLGQVPEDDMLRTFNMGVGLALVVAERDLERVAAALKKRHEKFSTIGRIIKGRPSVKYVES